MNLRKIIDKYNENTYLILLDKVPLDKKEECFNLIVEKLKQKNKFFNLNMYIEKLSGELRLKYIELYDFKRTGSYNSIIEGVTDSEIIYKLLVHALDKVSFNFYIKDIFDLVPLTYKEDFFYLIAEKERKIQKNIIFDSEIEKYLLKFNIEQRSNIIKNIVFPKFNYDYATQKYGRITEYYYANILKSVVETNVSLEDSKIYDILLFLLEESKKSINESTKEPRKIYNIIKILNVFLENGCSLSDIKKILKALIDSKLVYDNDVVNIIKQVPMEFQKEITTFIIDYYLSNNNKMHVYDFYTAIGSLNKSECIELFNKYVIKEKKYDYIYALQKTESCLFYANQLFDLMTSQEIDEHFERINTAIILNGRKFAFEEGYENIIKIYSEKYNVNYWGLYKFIQNFGFITLKYLTDEKIRRYINLPQDKLNKLITIFNDDNYYFNKAIKNDIVNSLCQREFMFKEKDIYNIFNRFEVQIANNNSLEVKKLLDFIQESYDINIILDKNNISYEEFYSKIMNGNLEILHQITDRFIAFKREEYIRKKLKNIDNDLIMDKVISRESYKKDLIENRSLWIEGYLQQLDKNLFSNEQLFLVENKKILYVIIAFKQNFKDYPLNPEYRKYLKPFNELLDMLYDNKIIFSSYSHDREDQKHLTFNSVQQQVDANYLFGILLESNYKGVCNIIDDEDLYLKLNEFLYKYKILGWQYTFNNILESCQMDFNEGTLAGLISNFDKIVDKIENKATLTSVIDYANCYSSSSKMYSLLYGREDFNLIAVNSGKNKSTMPKHDRLRKNMELVNKMYKREYITTPSINKTFELGYGKNINVVLGNTTNMMNLTYGERTDSCMRQGGAFDDLFHYCIENENGFHIKFSNPKTGNFVSRVSGLRNGNTIFLNELRISVDEEYTNADLYIAIKEVANYLINMSKDSKVPIDNVIITTDYALELQREKSQELGLTKEQLKKALNDVSFNFKDKGLVLATSNEDNSLVDYNFNIDLPKYNLERDGIKVYNGKNAKERIIQLTIINNLLNGGKLEDINIENFKEQPDYLVSGEDFYVSFKNGNTNIFILDKSKENKKTNEEIQKILDSSYNIEKDQTRSISL